MENLDVPFLQEQLQKKQGIHVVIFCNLGEDIFLSSRNLKYPVLFAHFVQRHFTAKCIACPSACPSGPVSSPYSSQDCALREETEIIALQVREIRSLSPEKVFSGCESLC